MSFFSIPTHSFIPSLNTWPYNHPISSETSPYEAEECTPLLSLMHIPEPSQSAHTQSCHSRYAALEKAIDERITLPICITLLASWLLVSAVACIKHCLEQEASPPAVYASLALGIVSVWTTCIKFRISIQMPSLDDEIELIRVEKTRHLRDIEAYAIHLENVAPFKVNEFEI